MKTVSLLILSAFSIVDSFLYGQYLTGKVMDGKNSPLPGANVYWINTSTGTVTDNKGEFRITSENINDKRLIISFVGYNPDTIFTGSINFISVQLKESRTLKEVQVIDESPDNYIPATIPIKTEVITAKELTKAACCDLAGCFNTQASVTPATTNVVTDSKELRILGLSGIYNQILIDGMPLINGLNYTYGISGIPGTLVENIYVAKGAASVLQGYESISGQINVLLMDAQPVVKQFINIYQNRFGETQYNAVFNDKSKYLSSVTAFHFVTPASMIDRDDDAFIDVPKLNRKMFYHKMKFRDFDSTGFSSVFGVRLLAEERTGGQLSYNLKTDKGSALLYGQVIDIGQTDVYSKSSYRFNEKNALALFLSMFGHTQDSWFGLTHYQGNQKNFYANLQYELNWSDANEFKTGLSYRFNDIDEVISFSKNPTSKTYDGPYRKIEEIPGIFAENIFRFKGDKITWITGLRYDPPSLAENGFIKNFITPRTLFKYEINEQTNIRTSVGTGWRTINVFSENTAILASQRDIIISKKLNPEQAVNYGINFTKQFEGEKMEGTFGVDFYRTEFFNQIFPDYDTDPLKIYFDNFTGTSVSNGFQIEENVKFYNGISSRIAYNYLDVYRIINGSKYILPFNSIHKILGTVSYKPASEEWHFDINFHWYGEQYLPNTSLNPPLYQRPQKSKSYTLVNAQFTRSLEIFDVYFGCENIFDFRQERPIIGWQNPFSPYFDTSSAWGPTRGREIYAGIRWRME